MPLITPLRLLICVPNGCGNDKSAKSSSALLIRTLSILTGKSLCLLAFATVGAALVLVDVVALLAGGWSEAGAVRMSLLTFRLRSAAIINLVCGWFTLKVSICNLFGATDSDTPSACKVCQRKNGCWLSSSIIESWLTVKPPSKRLASKLEKTPAGFYEQAQETLTTSIPVSEADLQALAKSRANAIQQQLLAAGLSQDRIALAPPVAAKAERALVPTKLTLDAIKH